MTTTDSKKRPRNARRWSWREYGIQLSVVILGVMVTFVGSGLIERWRQARQVRATMQLIAGELAYDRAQVESVCERLRFDLQGMHLFERYGKEVERIPEDSLMRYLPLLGAMRAPAFRTDALEVLKTSGVIQSVSDKGFLMELLGCYGELESFEERVGLYNQRKLEAMNHFLASEASAGFSRLTPREAWRRMLEDPLCYSFVDGASNFFGDDGEAYFDRTAARVAATVQSICQRYGFESTAEYDTVH